MPNTRIEIARRECDEVELTLFSNGIMKVYYKDNAEVTVDVLKWVIKNVNEMTDEKIPFVYLGGEFISVTKEAATFRRKTQHLLPCNAKAIIVKNLAQKLLADFHFRITKNYYPLKIFRTEKDACNWLSLFAKKPDTNCA